MEFEIAKTPTIRALIREGTLFVVNHSGGKDSQAMTILLQRIIPKEQLVIVHAELPEVEWGGTVDFIKKWPQASLCTSPEPRKRSWRWWSTGKCGHPPSNGNARLIWNAPPYKPLSGALPKNVA